jgi:biopolymer transport protein ExbD
MKASLPETGPDPAPAEFRPVPTEVFLRAGTGTVHVLLGTREVRDLAELEARPRGRHRSREICDAVPTIIHADDTVPWQLVVLAMDAARTVGVTQVCLGAPADLASR